MKSQIHIKRTIIHSEHILHQAHPEGTDFFIGLAERNGSGQIRLTLSHEEARNLFDRLKPLFKGVIAFVFAFAATTTTHAQILISDANTAPPTLYEITHEPTTTQKEAKVLFLFDTRKKASDWMLLISYGALAIGGGLDGYAEMRSRYYGTYSDYDTYHLTRDAGHIVTGFGAAALGAHITLQERPRVGEIICKALAGAIFYRCVAEATYYSTKPR